MSMVFTKIDGFVATVGDLECFLKSNLKHPNFREDMITLDRIDTALFDNYSYEEIENEMFRNTGGNLDSVQDYKNILSFKISKSKNLLAVASDTIGCKLDFPGMEYEDLFKENNWQTSIRDYLHNNGVTDWETGEFYNNRLQSVLDAYCYTIGMLQVLISEPLFGDWDSSVFNGMKVYGIGINKKKYSELHRFLIEESAIPKSCPLDYFVRSVRTCSYGRIYEESKSRNKLVYAIKQIAKYANDEDIYKKSASDSFGMEYGDFSRRSVESDDFKKGFPSL